MNINNDWQFFHRQRARSVGSAKALSDYLNMAEAHRVSALAQGMNELRRRATGQVADPALDRQSVFADLVQTMTKGYQVENGTAEFAFGRMIQETQLIWCCCFMDSDMCDEIADLLEEKDGWPARANFIITLAAVRDALGPVYFAPRLGSASDFALAARDRMLQRWQLEAVAADFRDPEFADAAARVEWIAALNADDLHEYILDYDWNATLDVPALEAVAAHPNCDLATALSIYMQAAPHFFDALRDGDDDGFDGAFLKVLDTVHARALANDFCSARFAPAGEIEPWLEYRDTMQAAKRPLRWVYTDEALNGCSGEPHHPKHIYQGDSRRFMKTFEEWSSLRLVHSI